MTTQRISFNEINAINVNKYVDDKSGLKYLSWSFAWGEIKKLDSEANFTIHENNEGHPFFVSPFGVDVKVSVLFNGISHTMRLPVLDGANKPMKVESYEYSTKYGNKSVEACNTFAINKTIMRCLVKTIALHGLGLYIYNGEDKPEVIKADVAPKHPDSMPVVVKEKAQETLMTVAQKTQVILLKRELNVLKKLSQQEAQAELDVLAKTLLTATYMDGLSMYKQFTKEVKELKGL